MGTGIRGGGKLCEGGEVERRSGRGRREGRRVEGRKNVEGEMGCEMELKSGGWKKGRSRKVE